MLLLYLELDPESPLSLRERMAPDNVRGGVRVHIWRYRLRRTLTTALSQWERGFKDLDFKSSQPSCLESRHVDDEAVFDISLDSAVIRLVDVLHGDLLDVTDDVVFATEVEHFLGFRDATDQ